MRRAAALASLAFAAACGHGSGACERPREPAGVSAPPTPATVELPLARLAGGASTRGAVRSVRSAGDHLELDVRLVGGAASAEQGGFGEVWLEVSELETLQRPWGDRARVTAQVRPGEALTGDFARPPRARVVLRDAQGRRMYLPHESLADRPPATEGWIALEGRPSTAVPIPLGHTEDGFDPTRIAAVGVNVEAGLRHGEVTEATVELRALAVRFAPPVRPEVLPPDPAVRASAAQRARRMHERLEARGLGAFTVGVNLPHPSAERSNGELAQLYGTWLDSPYPDEGVPFDLRVERVQQALRRDLRAIVSLFGAPAVVRVMLFADLRSGVEFDEQGMPVRISEAAQANLRRLLEMAEQEQVLLVPVLTDFMLADGVARQGPGGAWEVGEHPELVLDADKRRALMALFEQIVRAHADHPAVLAWEVMNEPENAAAVVTPERFVQLQRFLREGVEAIHRAGELATVGHRNPLDAERFMKDRLAVDLGQAHFYPRLETHPAPFDLAFPPERAFGPVPAGWGEAPLRPSRLGRDLEDAAGAGHRLLLLWSWRGDDPSGDGLHLRRHREAIEALLP